MCKRLSVVYRVSAIGINALIDKAGCLLVEIHISHCTPVKEPTHRCMIVRIVLIIQNGHRIVANRIRLLCILIFVSINSSINSYLARHLVRSQGYSNSPVALLHDITGHLHILIAVNFDNKIINAFVNSFILKLHIDASARSYLNGT